MAEELARRPTTARSRAEKTETDPKRIAEQLAKALREAGLECVIVLPSNN
jgi:ribosomal protein S12 methylthiotransferase accessory factor YcaO